MPDTSAEQGVVTEQTIVSQSTLTMRVIIGRPRVIFPGSLEPERICAGTPIAYCRRHEDDGNTATSGFAHSPSVLTRGQRFAAAQSVLRQRDKQVSPSCGNCCSPRAGNSALIAAAWLTRRARRTASIL